jgi:hypothetical protein
MGLHIQGDTMTKAIPDRLRRASGHFTYVFKRLVLHKGMEAEDELIESLGRDRLKALYDGAEPRLGDLVEVSRVLDVPLSAFQIHEKGGFSELEVAFAEVMLAASAMTVSERIRLIEEIARLPKRIVAEPAPDTSEVREDAAPLPETLLSIIRRAAE